MVNNNKPLLKGKLFKVQFFSAGFGVILADLGKIILKVILDQIKIIAKKTI
jgi:hypothetical protein